jgi:transposase InsO family protein
MMRAVGEAVYHDRRETENELRRFVQLGDALAGGIRVNGWFYYWYLLLDLYGRKIVGYEVYDSECEVRVQEVSLRGRIWPRMTLFYKAAKPA